MSVSEIKTRSCKFVWYPMKFAKLRVKIKKIINFTNRIFRVPQTFHIYIIWKGYRFRNRQVYESFNALLIWFGKDPTTIPFPLPPCFISKKDYCSKSTIPMALSR